MRPEDLHEMKVERAQRSLESVYECTAVDGRHVLESMEALQRQLAEMIAIHKAMESVNTQLLPEWHFGTWRCRG